MCAVRVLKIRRPNCWLMTTTIIKNFRGKIVKHDVTAAAVGVLVMLLLGILIWLL